MRTRRKAACLALIAGVVLLAETPIRSQALSPRNANYDIDVTLDPSARTITATETIDWRNTGTIAAYSLRLHLYWNAFRGTNSTWMRQYRLGGRTDFDDRPESDYGRIDISQLEIVGAGGESSKDLTAELRFISPDDQNADDRTLAAVTLPTAVAPGESLRLRIAWTGKFPRNFDRTGVIGDYFFVSQWFPKLGVFETGGWNARQFFANTEFFSDFGRYDVRITVPDGWVVGATGVEQSRTPAASGTITHRYLQDDVHDFAWTTSPDFVERRQRFEHPTLPAVDMRLLLQPEHLGQADRHFAATAAALRYYGEWYGPYPYGHITIVDPAYQSDSGGMEYPTIFTGGTRWLAPRQSNEPEYVVVHEAGHQFWYGIVANDEVEHAWMDEGINQFSDSRVQTVAFQPNYLVQRFFGGFIPWRFRDIPLSRGTDTNYLNAFRRDADRDAPSSPTYLYWPGSHQVMSYHKTALWLHTLERRLGWELLQKILSTFFERWKFKHPSPDDFFAVVNEVTRQDYTWFFDRVYRSSNRFDYAVERLTTETAVDGMLRTTVVVRRLEAGQFPVDIVVRFADGEQTRENWDGLARWHVVTYDRKSKALSATVDPERVLLLDTNYTNNSRAAEPATDAATTKWALKWMVWLQDLLMTYAFFV